MGRQKPNKPRRERPVHRRRGGAVPRFVDLPGPSLEEKKNLLLSTVLDSDSGLGGMIRASLEEKYGAYTVDEADIMSLPSPVREEALDALHTYASAGLPPGAPEELREQAGRTARNAEAALKRILTSGLDQRRRRAIHELYEESPDQAVMSAYMTQIAGEHRNSACFICGDTEDTDWYRWTDSTKEGWLCADCVEIQQRMYSSGPGDHLVKVVRVVPEEAPEDFDEGDAYDVDPHDPNDPTNR